MPQPAVSAAKSVAVLPFANMSADPENEYFTDGMAEEIINALSKIQSLRVASRTSSFAFKGKNEDIGEIGRKLQGVDGSRGKRAQDRQPPAHHRSARERRRRISALVGALRSRAGGRVRDPGRHFAGNRESAAGDSERRREEADRAGSRGECRGIRLLPSRTTVLPPAPPEEPRVRAADVQQRDRDRPRYALAHAGVADCCSLLYTYFDAREFNLRQAEIASSKALELEPELAEAHVARGFAVSLSKQFDEAEQEFETAMQLDPKLFEAAYWSARSRSSQGMYDEAVKLFERAARPAA